MQLQCYATVASFSAHTADQTGTTYAVQYDGGANGKNIGWAVGFVVTQTGGATSPTTDCALQHSIDKATWIDVEASTQLTADGTAKEITAITALGPFIRVTTKLGGGTKPSATAKVVLMSTVQFKLTAVSG